MSSRIPNEYIQGRNNYPFQMDHLPELFIKKCQVELNETAEIRRQKLQELTAILSGNKATGNFDFEEDLLVQFLRHSKYDVQRALKHIQNYVALRKKHDQLFKSLPDDYFELKKSVQFVVPLPERSPDGCTIVMTRPGKWDPSEMDYDDLVRLSMMTFCQIMRDPMTQINGFKVIHDFKGTTWEHYRYCTPWNLHFLFYATMDCIPARYKEIHFINDSFVMRTVWNIIKRFLSAKIRSRMYFHSKIEELQDHFPRSLLPAEYGGDIETISMEWLRKANKEHEKNTIEGQSNLY